MDRELIKRFYKSLYRIRKVEEEIIRIYPSDKIKSPVHLSLGQEFVSVGVCEALRDDDVVFGTYRGHAMYLAKGGNLNIMIAELYGKITGCAKGKGGSMHMIDIENGVMGTSAIVGTTIPVSVGYAYSQQYNKSDNVVVSFFGDGAVDEGAFHEGLNFAALKKIPILFICENNHYAIHSHHLERHSSDNIYKRAKTYGMNSDRIISGNIFEIYQKAKECVANIRNGKGPYFLEIITSRWREHVGPNDDFGLGYRTEKEVLYWKRNDQIKKIKSLLDIFTANKIEKKIEKEIKEAFEFAENSLFPDEDELYSELYKG